MIKNNRRDFIEKAGIGLGVAIAFPAFSLTSETSFEKKLSNFNHVSPEDLANEEDFWSWVQQCYTVSPNIINLNNGGVSPHPKQVQEALDTYNRLSNEAPSYYMWRILDKGREGLREKLALIAGCSPDEIAINRNATEALETIIFGLDLKKGDEVVVCKYDYPNMMNAWKQREKRDGIVLKWVDIPVPCENNFELVKLYEEQFSSKTKVVHITHLINWNGQIMPVKEIAAKAKERNILVLVDGAHSFAHLEYKVPDLNCDFWGTSLHKWLCAPFGTGMMYINKNQIKNVWPLFSPENPQSDDIRKFEALGTRSFPIEQATGHAINFHNAIGMKRKEARLRFLKNYWVQRVKDIPKIQFYSPISDNFSCAIATVGIKGMEAADIENKLMELKKVHCVAIKYEKINGVRITPNVYTKPEDLDRLVEGLKKLAES
jgi:selenocysteine lyase/cysteine desulfurase